MVEISVAVASAAGAQGLVQRLGELFERSSISFDGARNEVHVCSEWESRSILRVVGAVEAWLAEDLASSATLSVGDRSYTMVGP